MKKIIKLITLFTLFTLITLGVKAQTDHLPTPTISTTLSGRLYNATDTLNRDLYFGYGSGLYDRVPRYNQMLRAIRLITSTSVNSKQPRIIGSKPTPTSTTYTSTDTVAQALANLNSGVIANQNSVSTNSTNISNEITRATAAEATLNTALNSKANINGTDDIVNNSYQGKYLQLAYGATYGTPPSGYGNIGLDANGSEIITKANGNIRTLKLPYSGNVNVYFPNAGTIHLADRDSVASKYDTLGHQPDYFYPGANFYKSRFNIAAGSEDANTIGATNSPTYIAFIGDSRGAYIAGYLRNNISQYIGLNGLGFIGFYNSTPYPGDITFSKSGSYTITRNDNTSPANWGINGSRADATTGATFTFTPTSKYRFDVFRLMYNITSGGGSFTYSIDGGTAVTVNTTTGGVDALGITTVNTGISGNTTHTILLTVTSGSVRFYGISFYNKAQNGVVLEMLQSGGSTAGQWNGNVSYTSQYLNIINPALTYMWLGRNDAVALSSPTTYINNIAGVVAGLALPATCPLVLLSEMPQGLSATGPLDTNDLALIQQYRSQLLTFAKTNGHSVFDLQSYVGNYTYLQGQGYYSDAVHPSDKFSFVISNALTNATMKVLESNSLFSSLNNYKVAGIQLPLDGTYGLTAATVASNGQRSDSQTGLYFPSGGIMDYRLGGVTQLKFSNNGAANAMISAFPTSTTPIVLYAFRQGSSVNRAFNISVNSDASTSFTTNNGTFNINAPGITFGTSTTVNTNAILDMSSVTAKGVIFPQMTNTTIAALVSPIAGTITWNTSTASFQYRITSGGGQFVNVLSDYHPTLQAGTPSLASFYLTAGTSLTTPVSGAIEFDGTNLYYTDATPTRRTVANLIGTQTLANKTFDRFRLTTGANTGIGSVTLVAGTAMVSNTAVTASSIILLTRPAAGGTTGTLTYTVSAGTSFTINSSSSSDTSTIAYVIIN